VANSARATGKPASNKPCHTSQHYPQEHRVQHKTIVGTISEEEKEAGGRQEIEIPLSREHVEAVLQISEFYAPHQAAEIKHVVEDETRVPALPRATKRARGKSSTKNRRRGSR
jgi:hypothetical protein